MGTTNRSRSRRKEANLDINQARQMLPLVKSIVRDIAEACDKLAKLSPESDRLDRHKTDLSWKERERRYAVHAELDATESARSAAMNELSTLGVAIIDPKGGVVGFPTRVNGRSGPLHLGAGRGERPCSGATSMRTSAGRSPRNG